MPENECPVCGEPNPTTSITVNNSESAHFTENTVGISEQDVVFDVSFEQGDDMVGITICQSCYQGNEHLTEEYIEEQF